MNVKQLKKALENLDPEMEVIMFSDEEGNNCLELRGIEEVNSVTEDDYHYEVIHPDDIEEEEDIDDDVSSIREYTKRLLLFP